MKTALSGMSAALELVDTLRGLSDNDESQGRL